MNKNSVSIFNSIVDRFLELELNAAAHIGDNDMYFLSLNDSDKQTIIQQNQIKIKETYASWRKRGDELTSKELEKEYEEC